MITIRKNRILNLTILTVASILLVQKTAYANTPLGWGFEAIIAPMRIYKVTFGLAAIGIVLIETLVYMKFTKTSLLKAFGITLYLNVVSGCIGFLTVGAFSSSCTFLPFLLAFPAITLTCISKYKPPPWFFVLPLATFIVGAIGPAFTSSAYTKFSPLVFFFIINMPLIFGFGMSVLIEASGAARAFDHPRIWQAILTANICSYLLLMLIYPIFGPNPYTINVYDHSLMYGNRTPQEVRQALELRHASNLYLLGLTGDEKYKWTFYQDSISTEMSILGRSTEYHHLNPHTAMTVAEFTLENYDKIVKKPGIYEDPELTKKQLKWYTNQFKYRSEAVDAISNNDQAKLNEIYDEWVKWNSKNPFPESKDYSHYNSRWEKDDIMPTAIIDYYIRHYKSTMINPYKMITDSTINSDELLIVDLE